MIYNFAMQDLPECVEPNAMVHAGIIQITGDDLEYVELGEVICTLGYLNDLIRYRQDNIYCSGYNFEPLCCCGRIINAALTKFFSNSE